MMESLLAFVSHIGGAPWLLGQVVLAYRYDKKFEVLPPEVLGEGLMFIGACVALGLLAAWLVHVESRGGRNKKPGQGSDAAAPARDVKTPAAVKRRGRKRKGEANAGQREGT